MKLLLFSDMEGISGIVDWDHVTPGHAEYMMRRRKLITGDVNDAIQGAFEGGCGLDCCGTRAGRGVGNCPAPAFGVLCVVT